MHIKVDKEQSTTLLLKRTVRMEMSFFPDSVWYICLFRNYFVGKLPNATFFCFKNSRLKLFHSSKPSGSSAKLAQIERDDVF